MDASPSPVKTAKVNPTGVSKWFKEEEFYWRSLASYIWLAMILPAIVGLYIIVINFSIFSPLQWIIDSISLILSFSTILYVILLQAVCILSAVSHARALSVQKKSQSSMLKLILFLFNPKQSMNIICNVFSSTLISRILICFASLNMSDESFLAYLGTFLGLFYSVNYYKDHGYLVTFPPIQQTCFFRFKKGIKRCCHNCVKFSLKALQFYYPLNIVNSFLFEDSFINSISNLCSINLFFNSFCIAMAISCVLNLTKILMHIFNTQVFTFPIVPAFTEQQNQTLADAMENDELFLKHLACLDYNILSTVEGARRLKIFDLTPPGNQAHCWTRTCSESLKLIQKMRVLLTTEHTNKQFIKDAPNNIGSQELFSAVGKPEVKQDLNKSWLSTPSEMFQSPKCEVTKKNMFKVKDQNTPPSENVNVVFENLQITLWCLEGLCNLVAVSIKEDKYGVVQQKLPDILAELLLLLEACEDFSKSSFNVQYTNHSQVEAVRMNNSHVISLKLAVKTGLYTITTAFGYHITNVRLNSTHKKRLHGFLEFVE